MPVFKERYTKDFTTITNEIWRDRRLSFRDKGLLGWMLSKPADWNFSYEGILAELDLDGKSALQKSVKALQEAKYLIIEKKRRNGKISESVWNVYDSPRIDFQYTVNQPKKQNTTEASPRIDLPYMVNPPLLNKDITKDTATKNAVPALEGGIQLDGKYYYRDPSTGGYVEKEDA